MSDQPKFHRRHYREIAGVLARKLAETELDIKRDDDAPLHTHAYYSGRNSGIYEIAVELGVMFALDNLDFRADLWATACAEQLRAVFGLSVVAGLAEQIEFDITRRLE